MKTSVIGIFILITMYSIAQSFRLPARATSRRVTNAMNGVQFSTSNSQINYEFITSPNNRKVKLLRSLDLKKFRVKENLVLAEGHRTVTDAVMSGAKLHTVMFTQKALSTPFGQKLNEMLRGLDQRVSICEVPDHIISTVTDTVNSQGVVAAFELPHVDQSLSSILKEKNLQKRTVDEDATSLLVILDGVRDPGNMGTLLRTSYGLGVDAVVAVSW